MEKMKIQCIKPDQPEFPKRLLQHKPIPQQLYYTGTMLSPQKKTVAIVGARDASPYGRYVAEWFAADLAGAGVQIISGMARGIDAASHYGALRAGGTTLAVLGCGVDVCYPPQNAQLYHQLQEQGGILSEYPPGTPPRGWQFPMRNRMISALADLVLVVEAGERSGSLITADWALEQGRDVYAVPGRITDRLSRGCNYLIQQGAGIAVTPEEVMFALFGETASKKKKDKNIHKTNDEMTKKIVQNNISGLARDEEMVYSCISLQPKHINEIIKETQFELQKVLSVVLSLEQKGFVKETTKNYYVTADGILT